jgi:hypothetical protein
MAKVPVNQPRRKNTDAPDVSLCDEDLIVPVPEAMGRISPNNKSLFLQCLPLERRLPSVRLFEG